MHILKNLLMLPFVGVFFVFQNAETKTAIESCTGTDGIYSDGTFEVGVTRFSPIDPSGKLVLVMPPTGGSTRIDLSYGQSFCQRGIAAIVVNSWSDDQEYNLELGIHDRLYRRAQHAIDIVLSHSSEKHVGILGTSLGASHAAIASMRNPRISSIFLIVGGAPISSILATSDQQILSEGKEKRFKIYGFRSTTEYEEALKKVIPFEPLSMKPVRSMLPHLGMAISNNDGTVPTRLQLNLKRAWVPTLVLESSLGHIGTILKTWLCYQNQIVHFFEKNLREP